MPAVASREGLIRRFKLRTNNVGLDSNLRCPSQANSIFSMPSCSRQLWLCYSNLYSSYAPRKVFIKGCVSFECTKSSMATRWPLQVSRLLRAPENAFFNSEKPILPWTAQKWSYLLSIVLCSRLCSSLRRSHTSLTGLRICYFPVVTALHLFFEQYHTVRSALKSALEVERKCAIGKVAVLTRFTEWNLLTLEQIGALTRSCHYFSVEYAPHLCSLTSLSDLIPSSVRFVPCTLLVAGEITKTFSKSRG